VAAKAPDPQRVRTAEGDAWQVHGELRAGTLTLHGIRLMASGLNHPQWNNGDVISPDADVAGARAFYSRLGVPWGVRVPAGMDWAHGTHLFRQRLMGVQAEDFKPAPAVPGLTVSLTTDVETVVRIDAEAFGSEPTTAWARGHVGAPGVETALAHLDGSPVGTAYAVFSDGLAGPAVYLAGVAVVPAARRRGVGAAMSSWLAERGFAAGASLAHLHPDDDRAARVYSRLGFAEVPGFDVYVDLD
jgi:GNAT superfamily N-acetyltransferase